MIGSETPSLAHPNDISTVSPALSRMEWLSTTSPSTITLTTSAPSTDERFWIPAFPPSHVASSQTSVSMSDHNNPSALRALTCQELDNTKSTTSKVNSFFIASCLLKHQNE